jgi:hypothetical protein
VRAAGPLRQALRQFRDLDYAYYIPYGLAALAMLAQAQGQLTRAGRLAGAAALRDCPQNWPWFAEPAHRVPERLVAAINCLRDDPTTAAAWTEGQRMSPDEAVEYALSAVPYT